MHMVREVPTIPFRPPGPSPISTAAYHQARKSWPSRPRLPARSRMELNIDDASPLRSARRVGTRSSTMRPTSARTDRSVQWRALIGGRSFAHPPPRPSQTCRSISEHFPWSSPRSRRPLADGHRSWPSRAPIIHHCTPPSGQRSHRPVEIARGGTAARAGPGPPSRLGRGRGPGSGLDDAALNPDRESPDSPSRLALRDLGGACAAPRRGTVSTTVAAKRAHLAARARHRRCSPPLAPAASLAIPAPHGMSFGRSGPPSGRQESSSSAPGVKVEASMFRGDPSSDLRP